MSFSCSNSEGLKALFRSSHADKIDTRRNCESFENVETIFVVKFANAIQSDWICTL